MKRLLLALAMIAGVFTLAGCGAQSYNLNINKNGSVDLAMEIQRTDGLNTLLNENGISEAEYEALMEDELSYYKKRGFDVGIEAGEVSIKKSYKNVESFNQDQAKLYKEGRGGLNVQIKKKFKGLKDEYIISGRMRYLLPYDIQKKISQMDGFEREELNNFASQYGHESVSLSIYYPDGAQVQAMDEATNGNGMVSFLGSSKDLLVHEDNLENNVGAQILVTNQLAIIGGGVLAVLLAGGAIYYFFFYKSKEEDE